jgi:hypothetical protein
MRYLGIFFVASALGFSAEVVSPKWLTPLEVERLDVALRLADYPQLDRPFRENVGLTADLPIIFGGGGPKNVPNAAFSDIALTDPESTLGYYFMRVHFLDEYPPPPPASLARPGLVAQEQPLKIAGAEIKFVNNGGTLVMKADENERRWLKMVPTLKKEMKEKNLTPHQMTELLPIGLGSSTIQVPNQLPDPTSPSVTPPAGAGAAPSVAADH